MHLTGGVSLETTQTELFGYTTALAESFVKPGFVYAGTDDGNVWATRNDGGSWENFAGRFPGLPNTDVYVARIDASHFDTLTFYVAFETIGTTTASRTSTRRTTGARRSSRSRAISPPTDPRITST